MDLSQIMRRNETNGGRLPRRENLINTVYESCLNLIDDYRVQRTSKWMQTKRKKEINEKKKKHFQALNESSSPFPDFYFERIGHFLQKCMKFSSIIRFVIRWYLLVSMYILQLIKMRTKPNVAKNAPSHKLKFISSNMVVVIVDLLLVCFIF